MEYKVKEVVTLENMKTFSDREMEKAPKYYKEMKAKHSDIDTVILFRCGDFYETYCDDAQTCHEILGVSITSNREYRICGFPFFRLDTYLPKLIRKGYRVAICEYDNNK